MSRYWKMVTLNENGMLDWNHNENGLGNGFIYKQFKLLYNM